MMHDILHAILSGLFNSHQVPKKSHGGEVEFVTGSAQVQPWYCREATVVWRAQMNGGYDVAETDIVNVSKLERVCRWTICQYDLDLQSDGTVDGCLN